MVRLIVFSILAGLLMVLSIAACNLGSFKVGYMGASLEFDFQDELHEVPHDLEHELYRLNLTPAGLKIYQQIAAQVDASTEDLDGTPKRYVLFASHPYLLVDTTTKSLFLRYDYVRQNDAGPGVGQDYEKK